MENITEEESNHEFENFQNEEPQTKRFTATHFVKMLAVMFVIAVYFVIFLKILFLS